MNQRILTGITTSGTPHLGNYVGAIRPAVQASLSSGVQSFYFLADYHALIKTGDPQRVARSRLEIAATWLASGLDPERVIFYRQSDIPEIPELCWMLTCVTPKGLMNRAHAYKALCDANAANNEDTDFGVSMGLFSYPVLMAADILMFNPHKVPVGRDQIQHIEMTRDIAQRFNHLYGAEFFTLPDALIEESVAILPGLDGRKMSKSYDNTIPLFEGSAKELKEAIMRMVTDSRLPGEPKDADQSPLYTLYRAFASDEQSADFKQALETGLGWGEAKLALFDLINGELSPMREHYHALMARPDKLDEILVQGAQRAREIATPLMKQLREAVGFRSVSTSSIPVKKAAQAIKKARFISFKQDGFQFRLLSPQGNTLLLSIPFDQPQDVGKLIAKINQQELSQLSDGLLTVNGTLGLYLDGSLVAQADSSQLTDLIELKQAILDALMTLKEDQSSNGR